MNTLGFSVLLVKILIWALFFDKLPPVYHRAATLLKRWFTIDFFLKISFLRQLLFDKYSKKNLQQSVFTAELQFVHYRLLTLLKQTPSFPNFYNQLCFVTSLFVGIGILASALALTSTLVSALQKIYYVL